MKKMALSALGGLGIILCGMILTVFVSRVPVGFSDEEVATIGRKFYYGLPWPCYVAEGSSQLRALGQAICHFPVNAIFWTAVVACVSCLPGKKISWRRILGVMISETVFFGAMPHSSALHKPGCLARFGARNAEMLQAPGVMYA